MTTTPITADTIYAVLDSTGRATAFYRSSVNPTIPSGAVQITAAQWASWLANPNQVLVNGQLQAPPS